VKTLVASRVCDASPRDAWQALRGFRWWVAEQDTVARDAADIGEQIDWVAERPLVLVYEGLHLRGRITALDTDRRMTLNVSWRGVLRAEFSYQILTTPEGCRLVCTRSYLGWVTRALGSVWKPREQEDQAALLRDWCWVAGSNAAQRRYSS